MRQVDNIKLVRSNADRYSSVRALVSYRCGYCKHCKHFIHSFIQRASFYSWVFPPPSVIMDAFVETKLREWGLECHIPNFASEGIDTKKFLSLTEESNRPLLYKLCGKIGPSAQLRECIRQLKRENDGHVHDMKTEDG